MIEPNKYLNLELSVINVSSKILVVLKDQEMVRYDELLKSLQNTIHNDVKDVFTESLSFLYLIGKIEYLSDIDAFSLVK